MIYFSKVVEMFQNVYYTELDLKYIVQLGPKLKNKLGFYTTTHHHHKEL